MRPRDSTRVVPMKVAIAAGARVGDLADHGRRIDRLLGQPEGTAGDGRDQRDLVAVGERAVAAGVLLVDGVEKPCRLVAELESSPRRRRPARRSSSSRSRPAGALAQPGEQADANHTQRLRPGPCRRGSRAARLTYDRAHDGRRSPRDRLGDRGQAGLHAGRRRRARARAARRVSVHARAVPDDVPRPAVDDPPVRGLRLGRGDERALPLPARARTDRALDRVRPARPSSATTRTIRARPARSGGPASRSTRSPTWSCSSTGSRSARCRRR